MACKFGKENLAENFVLPNASLEGHGNSCELLMFEGQVFPTLLKNIMVVATFHLGSQYIIKQEIR